jgi:hypothetical protein
LKEETQSHTHLKIHKINNKQVKMLINTSDKKERNLQTNMILHFRNMEMWTKDTGYKSEPCTHPSYLLAHNFITMQRFPDRKFKFVS